MNIKVSGFNAKFEQLKEDEFNFELVIFGDTGEEIQKYKGEVDLDVIKQVEVFYEENKRFPSTSELNKYMKKHLK
jgi:hypothetical protein